MRRPHISPIAVISILGLIALNSACLIWNARLSSSDPVSVRALPWQPEVQSEIRADERLAAAGPTREILARPVFFRNRRPHVPHPPPVPPAPEPVRFVAPSPVTRPKLSLSGVMLGEGVKQAYVHFSTEAQGRWVREGDEIIGWRVTRITNDGIAVAKAEHSFDFVLYDAAGGE